MVAFVEFQFGFRKETIKYAEIITLDIKNSFNTINCCQILTLLVEMKTTQYIYAEDYR